MNLFTRITATLGATADSAVSRFENHDAIAESALIPARQALTKARIRHNHLVQTGDDIRERLDTARTEANQWTVRARKLAETDEQKALECLEYRCSSLDLVESLTGELTKHDAMEESLTSRLSKMQQRLDSLTHQRNEMRSRESLAKATDVLDRIDSHNQHGVDAIFERWEVSISDTEIRHEVHQDVGQVKPPLQREFEEDEKRAKLKTELAQLLTTKEDASDE